MTAKALSDYSVMSSVSSQNISQFLFHRITKLYLWLFIFVCVCTCLLLLLLLFYGCHLCHLDSIVRNAIQIVTVRHIIPLFPVRLLLYWAFTTLAELNTCTLIFLLMLLHDFAWCVAWLTFAIYTCIIIIIPYLSLPQPFSLEVPMKSN